MAHNLNNMMTETITVYNDNDEEIHVTVEFVPGEKGSRDYWGAPLEPDIPDSFEILEALDIHGDPVELTPNQQACVYIEADERFADDMDIRW